MSISKEDIRNAQAAGWIRPGPICKGENGYFVATDLAVEKGLSGILPGQSFKPEVTDQAVKEQTLPQHLIQRLCEANSRLDELVETLYAIEYKLFGMTDGGSAKPETAPSRQVREVDPEGIFAMIRLETVRLNDLLNQATGAAHQIRRQL